ncbi:MAG: hypothetical protein AAF718_08345 [Pseudomonadota bacterium]
MSPEAVEHAFTRSDGSYLFARWGRPIAPVVFGVDDATLSIVKGAIEAIAVLADHRLTDMDPELGANFMVFFIRDWDELAATPDLDRLLPELPELIVRLKAVEANQYRAFRFDPDGAIKAAFVFVRMDEALSALPAEDLALAQAVQTIVLWSDEAFKDRGPLATIDGKVILNPEVAAIVRAAYDPVLPAVATDPSHALRLAARLRTGTS